jgi:hypothetical protein
MYEVRKEAVYLNVISRRSLTDNEENRDKPQSGAIRSG